MNLRQPDLTNALLQTVLQLDFPATADGWQGGQPMVLMPSIDLAVVRFARDVGSPEVLRMLAVLTAADVTAVGPGTWTRWKADLLGELYFRALGTLDGESREQHGPILYPKDARLVLGAYADANESFPMHGRLGQVVVYDLSLIHI